MGGRSSFDVVRFTFYLMLYSCHKFRDKKWDKEHVFFSNSHTKFSFKKMNQIKHKRPDTFTESAYAFALHQFTTGLGGNNDSLA